MELWNSSNSVNNDYCECW